MERSFVECEDASISNPHAVKMVMDAHKNLLVEIKNQNLGLGSNPCPNGENATNSNGHVPILDPAETNPRGRLRTDTRLRSSLEINTSSNRGRGRRGTQG
ncbi:hypothetical protein OROMI_020060 [Orobanche minor]